MFGEADFWADDQSEHDAAVEDVALIEALTGQGTVRADHTDLFRDPDPVNGHVPDVAVTEPGGGLDLTELETDPMSTHSQEQNSAFRREVQGDPDDTLDTVVLEDGGLPF